MRSSDGRISLVAASRIKTLRYLRGLTVRQLADAINLNFYTYSGYEHGKSAFPLYVLVRIADFFDVSLDFLTGRK